MSEKEYKECPNCNSKIGGWSGEKIIGENLITIINESSKKLDSSFVEKEAYCENCTKEIKEKYSEKLKEASEDFDKLNTNDIILFSTSPPQNWEYEYLDLFSTYCLINTNQWDTTDSFDTSKYIDQKWFSSTVIDEMPEFIMDYCKEKLRKKVITMGGNALIGVKIDCTHSWVDSENLYYFKINLLGTVIKLNNIADILSDTSSKNVNELSRIGNEISLLKNLSDLEL